jgi:hypothetical protein
LLGGLDGIRLFEKCQCRGILYIWSFLPAPRV